MNRTTAAKGAIIAGLAVAVYRVADAISQTTGQGLAESATDAVLDLGTAATRFPGQLATAIADRAAGRTTEPVNTFPDGSTIPLSERDELPRGRTMTERLLSPKVTAKAIGQYYNKGG